MHRGRLPHSRAPACIGHAGDSMSWCRARRACDFDELEARELERLLSQNHGVVFRPLDLGRGADAQVIRHVGAGLRQIQPPQRTG